MQLHLELFLDALVPPIRHEHRLLVEGSCFATEIGQRLLDHKMQVQLQPHGILYNPISIANALESYLEGRIYAREDLVFRDGLWHSWDHHGSFSDSDPDRCLERINLRQQEAANAILQADWLVLSLGSSQVYTWTDTDYVVANCHKFPKESFRSEMLSPERVIATLDNIMHRLFLANRKLRLLFTLSPVRYLKGGAVENQLSKSILHVSIQHLVRKFDRLHYFPAYELIMDELRDYRFYGPDLVHPNALAQDYVWERFLDTCMDPDSRALMGSIDGLLRAAAHRPLHPGTEAHRTFMEHGLRKVLQLEQQVPYGNFSRERAAFGG